MAGERQPVTAGAFVLYVHPRDPHPFLNYAIPAPGAEDGDDGTALAEAARARGLIPRLEYIEPCFPWVEDAVSATGFVREGRLSMMTATLQQLREAPSTVELVKVEPGSPRVRATVGAMRAAFGEPPPSDDDVAAWQGPAIAALVDGEVVGAAGWTRVIDRISEIVGVGVVEASRRRGIGAALTAGAARAAFADGATLAILTPGDDGTASVYRSVGFGASTTMLHVRRPG